MQIFVTFKQFIFFLNECNFELLSIYLRIYSIGYTHDNDTMGPNSIDATCLIARKTCSTWPKANLITWQNLNGDFMANILSANIGGSTQF